MSGNIYCRKSQCLLFTFRNFLLFGILWLGILLLGILLLGTLCVRNFVIMNFEIRNFVPAPWAHLCVSSTVQQSVLSPEVSVLQQLVLYLDTSVQQQPVLFQKMACLQQLVVHLDCLSTRASAAPRRSVYKSFCVHLRCPSNIWSLCCTYACLSTRAFLYTWGVCLQYRACAALICAWKCLSSRACAAFVHFCLPELCSASVLVWSLQERWVI